MSSDKLESQIKFLKNISRIFLACSLFALITLIQSAFAVGPWVQTASTSCPTTAAGSAMTYYNGTIYIIPGGTTTFFSFNPSTETCSSLAATPATFSQTVNLAPIGNNKIYAQVNGAIYIYDIGSNSWAKTTTQSLLDNGDLMNNGTSGTTQINGNSIVFINGELYMLLGGSTAFWKYSPSTNSWTTLAVTPSIPYSGTSLIATDSNTLYASSGYSTNFWRYNIGSNTWTTLTSAPGTFGPGASLAHDGSNYIYALQGNNQNDFWRYDIAGNSWITYESNPSDISKTPDLVRSGGELIYVGGNLYAFQGNNTRNFWKYTISTKTWSALSKTNENIGKGSGLVYDSTSGRIYAISGSQNNRLWYYSISGDTWTEVNQLPVIPGGSSTSVSSDAGGLAFDSVNRVIYFCSGVGTSGTTSSSTALVYRMPLTGINANKWPLNYGTPSTLPYTFGEGSALTYPGITNISPSGNLLFGLVGNSSQTVFSFEKDFNTFIPNVRSTTINDQVVSPNVPDGLSASTGSNFVEVDGFVYFMETNDPVDFLRYNISNPNFPTNTWVRLAPPRLTSTTSLGMSVIDSDTIMLSRNTGDSVFNGTSILVYKISTNSWDGPALTGKSKTGQVYSFLSESIQQNNSELTEYNNSFYTTFYHTTDYNTFWKFTPSTNTWIRLADPSSYYGNSFTKLGNYIYSVYGHDSSSSTIQQYNIENDTWNNSFATTPSTILDAVIVGVGDWLYLTRGNNTNTFWRYCPITTSCTAGTWETLNTVPSNVNDGAEITACGDYIFLISSTLSSTLKKYSITSGTWSTTAAFPYSTWFGTSGTFQNGATIACDGNYVYATMGNYASAGVHEPYHFMKYDIAENSWSLLTSLPVASGYFDYPYNTSPGKMIFASDGDLYYIQGINDNKGPNAYSTADWSGGGLYRYQLTASPAADQNTWVTNEFDKPNAPPNSGDQMNLQPSASSNLIYYFSNAGRLNILSKINWEWINSVHPIGKSYSNSEAPISRKASNFPSDKNCMIYINGLIYLYGFDDGRFYNYNPLTNKYKELNYPANTSTNCFMETVNGQPDYIYVILGTVFKRYSVSTDTWTDLAEPAYSAGFHELEYPGAGDWIYSLYLNYGQNELIRYSISGDFWVDRYLTQFEDEDGTFRDYQAINIEDINDSQEGYGENMVWRKNYSSSSDDEINYFNFGNYDFYEYNGDTNSWSQLANSPSGSSNGSAIEYVNYGGEELVFMLDGDGSVSDSSKIYRYCISDAAANNDNTCEAGSTTQSEGTWTTMSASTGVSVSYGGSLVWQDGSQYLYMTRGNGTADYYRYDISANSWATRTSASSNLNNGTKGTYYSASNSIYYTVGGGTSVIRYDIAGNSWSSEFSQATTFDDSTAITNNGSKLYLIIGNNTATFYEYDISGATLTAKQALPRAMSSYSSGGAVYNSSRNEVYYTPGNFDLQTYFSPFYYYQIASNDWPHLAPPSDGTSTGNFRLAALTSFNNDNSLYYLRGEFEMLPRQLFEYTISPDPHSITAGTDEPGGANEPISVAATTLQTPPTLFNGPTLVAYNNLLYALVGYQHDNFLTYNPSGTSKAQRVSDYNVNFSVDSWKKIARGMFKVTVDGTTYDINEQNFSAITKIEDSEPDSDSSLDDVEDILNNAIGAFANIEFCNDNQVRIQTNTAAPGGSVSAFFSSAQSEQNATLTAGTNNSSVIATWQAVTDGSFSINLNGIAINVTGLNFSSDTTMAQVASRMQTALRAASSWGSDTETVTWNGSVFVFVTHTTVTYKFDQSISYLTAVGTGTDISGAGFIDGRSDGTGVSLIQENFNIKDSITGLDLSSDSGSVNSRVSIAGSTSGAWEFCDTSNDPEDLPYAAGDNTQGAVLGDAIVLNDINEMWYLNNEGGRSNTYGDAELSNNSIFFRYKFLTDEWPVFEGLALSGISNFNGIAMTYLGGTYYIIPGYNTSLFYSYNPSTNSWTNISSDPLPGNAEPGASMVTDGTYIYATRGNNSTDFYRYNPSAAAGTRWTTLPSTPVTVGTTGIGYTAGALAIKDGNIYLHSGNATTTFTTSSEDMFYRYNIADNEWKVYEALTAHTDATGGYKSGSDFTSLVEPVSATLYCGATPQTTIATWQAVTNGSYNVILDGVSRTRTGLNFSTATNLDNIASIIETDLQTASGSSVSVNYDSTNTRFIFTSGASPASTGSISDLNTTGTGTEISSNYLDCDESLDNAKPLPYSAENLTIYALQGGNSTNPNFAKFIPYIQTWLRLPNLDIYGSPSTIASVAQGGNTATNGNDLFAFRGNVSSNFQIFSINQNTWMNSSPAFDLIQFLIAMGSSGAPTSKYGDLTFNSNNNSLYAISGTNSKIYQLNLDTRIKVTTVNGGNDPSADTPFNIEVSLVDYNNDPVDAPSNVNFTVSVDTGNGTISGTTTGTISSGNSSETVSISYSIPDSNVQLLATDTSPSPVYDNETSDPFNVDFPAPSLLSVVPDSGSQMGGNSVVINGDNLLRKFRVPITIDNTSGPLLTDYQVSTTLNTSTLISNGKMLNSDCSDLHVLDSNQTTLLPYWIEGYTCNSASTTIWFKTTISASSTKTVYLEYGDESGLVEQDGEAVFNFFEDFDKSTVLNSDKWTASTGLEGDEITTGFLSLTYNGIFTFQSAEGIFAGNYAIPANSIIEGRYYHTSTSNVGSALRAATNTTYGFVGNGTTNVVSMLINSGNTVSAETGSGDTALGSINTGTAYHMKITYRPGDADQADFDFNKGQYTATRSGTNAAGTLYPTAYFSVIGLTPYLDYYFIRTYTANPPTVTNGTETWAGTDIDFGANGATSISGGTLTQLTGVIVPAAASPGAVNVTATNPSTSTATLTNGYTYLSPSITNISPSSGPTSGGTEVTITGVGFADEYYTRDITVSNPGGTTLTNQEIPIIIDTASLISATKMRSDCGDIRIYDDSAAGLGELPYWIDNCNSTTTIVWTEIPSLPAAGKTIQIKYGNSSLTSRSDLSKIFPVLTSNIRLWLKANNGTNTQTNNATVTSWTDISGNGNNLSSSSGAPQFKTNQINSLPSVFFDGTDDSLIRSGYNYLPQSSNERSLFQVANYSSNGNGGFTYGSTSSNAASGLIVGTTGNLSHTTYTTTTSSGQTGNGAGYKLHGMYMTSSSSFKQFVNDLPETTHSSVTFTTGAPASSEIEIGREIDNSPYVAMYMAESIIFGKNLNTTEKTEIKRYLNTKYNLYGNNPSATIGAEEARPAGITVTFDGTPATNVRVLNSTTIKAITPANSSGSANVVATFQGSISTPIYSGYTYNSMTLVSSDITSLVYTGGETITITGTNFFNNNYQREITVHNSTGSTQTDAKVFAKLNTSELISGGKMRSDCGDIRAYDSDASTAIPFWIDGCNQNNTLIWVKIPSVASTGSKIYLKYGNAYSNSLSSLEDIFPSLSSPDTEFWLKANNGPDTQTDGAQISQWSDKSGNNNHLTQATGSLQPLLRATGLNNLPTVDFDGTDDYLYRSGFSGLPTGNTGRTMFHVAKYDSTSSAGILYGTNACGESFGLTINSSGYLTVNQSCSSPNIISAEKDWFKIHGIRAYSFFNENTSFVNFINGSSSSSTPYGSGSGTGTTEIEMGRSMDDSLFANMESAETIILSRPVSDTEFTEINNYLNTKYNIYGQVLSTTTGPETQKGGSTRVKFDTTDSADVNVINSTTMTAKVPAHATGAVNIEVIQPDLTSQTLGVTYVATIDTVTPSSGSTAGGDRITIQGKGFGDIGYNRDISVTNPAGSILSNYEVFVELNTQILIDEGKMKSDCGDIRVHDSDGEALSYWLDGCDLPQSLLWIEIPSLPIAGKTIYLRYGNSSLTSLSSLAMVFPTLSSNVKFWLKPHLGTFHDSTSTPVYYENQTVGILNDQGGASNENISQTTVGNRPVLKQNQINSLPTIDFDGSNDYLQATGIGEMTSGTNPRTMYQVAKYDSNGYGGVSYGNNSGGATFGLEISSTGYLTFDQYGTAKSSQYIAYSGSSKGFRAHGANFSNTTSTGVTQFVNNGKATLICGPAPLATISTWKLITNGTYQITLDGISRTPTSLNFTSINSLHDVAAILQTNLRTLSGSLVEVVYNSNHNRFYFISAASPASNGSISDLNPGGSGTQLYSAYLDCDTSLDGADVITDEQIHTGADINTSTTKIEVGREIDSTPYINMDLAETILFGISHNDSERAEVSRYLNTKYSLYGADTPSTTLGDETALAFSSGSLPVIKFDTTNATDIFILSQEEAYATNPAHSAGAVNVSITTPDSTVITKTNGFTYAGPPTAPTNFSATAIPNGANLSWNWPTDKGGLNVTITQYQLQYGINGGACDVTSKDDVDCTIVTSCLDTTPADSECDNASTHSLNSLSPGTLYDLGVFARNSGNEWGPAAQTTVTPLVSISDPDSSISATPTSDVEADNVDYSTITVTLRDNTVTPLPGLTVVLTQDNYYQSYGDTTITAVSCGVGTPGVTNINGEACFEVKSYHVGTYQYSASVPSHSFTLNSGLAYVTFVDSGFYAQMSSYVFNNDDGNEAAATRRTDENNPALDLNQNTDKIRIRTQIASNGTNNRMIPNGQYSHFFPDTSYSIIEDNIYYLFDVPGVTEPVDWEALNLNTTTDITGSFTFIGSLVARPAIDSTNNKIYSGVTSGSSFRILQHDLPGLTSETTIATLSGSINDIESVFYHDGYVYAIIKYSTGDYALHKIEIASPSNYSINNFETSISDLSDSIIDSQNGIIYFTANDEAISDQPEQLFKINLDVPSEFAPIITDRLTITDQSGTDAENLAIDSVRKFLYLTVGATIYKVNIDPDETYETISTLSLTFTGGALLPDNAYLDPINRNLYLVYENTGSYKLIKIKLENFSHNSNTMRTNLPLLTDFTPTTGAFDASNGIIVLANTTSDMNLIYVTNQFKLRTQGGLSLNNTCNDIGPLDWGGPLPIYASSYYSEGDPTTDLSILTNAADNFVTGQFMSSAGGGESSLISLGEKDFTEIEYAQDFSIYGLGYDDQSLCFRLYNNSPLEFGSYKLGQIQDVQIPRVKFYKIIIKESPPASPVGAVGSTTLREGGATDTYTIELAETPTDPVNVTFTNSTLLDNGLPLIVFSPTSGSVTLNDTTPSTITLDPNIDGTQQGERTEIIAHTASSVELFYNNAIIRSISALATDTDSAGAKIIVNVIGTLTMIAPGNFNFPSVLSGTTSPNYSPSLDIDINEGRGQTYDYQVTLQASEFKITGTNCNSEPGKCIPLNKLFLSTANFTNPNNPSYTPAELDTFLANYLQNGQSLTDPNTYTTPDPETLNNVIMLINTLNVPSGTSNILQGLTEFTIHLMIDYSTLSARVPGTYETTLTFTLIDNP